MLEFYNNQIHENYKSIHKDKENDNNINQP